MALTSRKMRRRTRNGIPTSSTSAPSHPHWPRSSANPKPWPRNNPPVDAKTSACRDRIGVGSVHPFPTKEADVRLISARSIAMTAAVTGFVLAAGFSQNPVVAQTSDQKAEQVFKNIQTFKGQRADMLNPTMVLFEAALGVGCGYCHDADANKRELDSKPQKAIARQMIEMVNNI